MFEQPRVHDMLHASVSVLRTRIFWVECDLVMLVWMKQIPLYNSKITRDLWLAAICLGFPTLTGHRPGALETKKNSLGVSKNHGSFKTL